MDNEEVSERPDGGDPSRDPRDHDPDVGDGGGLVHDDGGGHGLRQQVPDPGGGAGLGGWPSGSEVVIFLLDTWAKVTSIYFWLVIFMILRGFFGCYLDD